MTFAVVYTKDAVDDIEEAFDWLAARAPSVAIDLLKAIGRAEVHLARNPGIYLHASRSPRTHARILSDRT